MALVIVAGIVIIGFSFMKVLRVTQPVKQKNSR
jgi:hypothetical protein